MKLLDIYKEKIPWLREMPVNMYYQLNPSEFYFPNGSISILREKLEHDLDMFVMTYNANIFNVDIPLSAHLCANIKGAKLTKEQLKTLYHYEYRVHEKKISFVVYKKPLEIINPSESPIACRYMNLV